MRKIIVVIIIFAFFYLGILLGKDKESYFSITQDKLDKFENDLENNNYNNSSQKIDPNVFNKVGMKIEELIDKGFEIFINILK